ncbi:uncharacterized protein MONOS_3282 [Monocercomonoides exilis]|uniref:uncharacterized protein n=1 Tax=Monocercomonoides exilis TaxID=2049356 RepID=UPI00355A5050|nr:hypothetical protein MONOS_3282 [Monocercomonoides exilis]|eukprot:MONOS_3282.1-p1 / transcript=MONOS_3282.1 / gene=MONOS_3282 / organism=Monocercomonoides_exilis_PA203 / gene_product=unspecified product / transcript_product=unspecified product / location=Mono_scaffold00076:36632-37487(+) / protein_length=265 / sequence_SO=supercontig / SO=protein_coding / is_pseudo=false
MKVAINKEESEETQKEVEEALLALSSIGHFVYVHKGCYLNEITNIIKYHQEHNNLTRLAYQSAWGFFINRFFCEREIEEVILNEIHFMREATQELENLEHLVDWAVKEKNEREWKNVLIIKRWMKTLHIFYKVNNGRLEENPGLFRCISRISKEVNGFQSDIVLKNIIVMKDMATMGKMNIDDFLRAGAVDFIASGIDQLALKSDVFKFCLFLFSEYKKKLIIIKNSGNDENRWKMLNRALIEKLEEGGFFDIPVVYFRKGIFE